MKNFDQMENAIMADKGFEFFETKALTPTKRDR